MYSLEKERKKKQKFVNPLFVKLSQNTKNLFQNPQINISEVSNKY